MTKALKLSKIFNSLVEKCMTYIIVIVGIGVS